MTKLKLQSSYRVVDEQGRIVMAKGRLEILESIQETGSINQTAKALKMSYKTVWCKLKTTERHLGRKVIISDKKHGTKLTPDGETLIECYQRLQTECIRADDKIFNRLFSLTD